MIEKKWLRAIVITAILALIVAFSGCGKKGDPLPTQIVIPAKAGIHNMLK